MLTAIVKRRNLFFTKRYSAVYEPKFIPINSLYYRDQHDRSGYLKFVKKDLVLVKFKLTDFQHHKPAKFHFRTTSLIGLAILSVILTKYKSAFSGQISDELKLSQSLE